MRDASSEALIRALVRARALEAELVGLRPEGLPPHLRGPLAVSPGVQAALVARGSVPPTASAPSPPTASAPPTTSATASGSASASASAPPPPTASAPPPPAAPAPTAPAPPTVGDVVCLRRASPAAALVLGVSPEALAHEALGSALAHARGRSPGGVPDAVRAGLLASVDPPGSMVEVMAGVALAFALRGEPRVAILVDEADASASGFWHEGLNFAAVQRAPLVLVIDSSRRHALTARVDRLAAKAPAYGVRAVSVEGDDPRLVYDAVADAVEQARGGGGTQLVEVVPGSHEDPVDRLARLDPALAAQLPLWREQAATEARAAAAAARACALPTAADAFHPVLIGGERLDPPWRETR